MERLKLPAAILLSLGLATGISRAASLSISSLSGPVTQSEINSFITYMQAQTPPQTPWGAVNGTTGDHNEWADGTGGRDLEAMGEMYEITSNVTILNQMISWCDDCTSQRNDLMSTANGGQRVMWTGKIDEVWCPNEPSSANAQYAGCENEDTEGHLAFCAKLILQSPGLWNLTVPDGNPYGYGVTYFQRATNYLAKCDEANEEYSLVWFINKNTSLIVAPTSAAWVAFDENVTANNRQMMFTSGFQRLAEAHAILGDNPTLEAQYNAIVQATINQDLTGMVHFDQYQKNGQTVYNWGYYPTTDAPEATEIHAEYDLIGVWRAFNNTNYGVTLAPLVPFANTMVNVVYLGTNTFAGDVSGGSGTQSPIYSGWLLTADWNPQVYTTVAGVAYTNGWYTGSEDIDAAILFMKNRRYQEFSVTPLQSSQLVVAGNNAQFAVAVAPLGGFTSTVNLTAGGLPSGATASFNPSSVNCATLNYFSTNSMLTIQTSGSTSVGTYTVSVISTSGAVSHTNLVNVVVGTYSLSASPSMLAIAPGNTANYTVTTTTNTGFSGTVSFGLGGLPANCSATFSPTSLNGNGSTTLSVIASNNTVGGTYTLTIYGTNGRTVISTTTMLQIAGAGTAVWNGGSATDNNWSDVANWSDSGVAANNILLFGGTSQLNNINDTTAGTTYSNMVFSASAGAFVLNGNPIILSGSLTNNSPNSETVDLGLTLNASQMFNGAAGMLIIGGGVTNGLNNNSLTLAGTGILTNLLGGTSATMTNTLTLNSSSANWTIVDNPSSTPITAPWSFSMDAGTLNFGSVSSAPNFSSTTIHNLPSDSLLGSGTGNSATLNIINGTLALNTLDTAASLDSTGVVNIAGGTLNLGPIGSFASDYFQGANGSNLGEVSAVNISSGTLNLSTGTFYVASRGTGSLIINGGTVSCGKLDVSRNADGNTFSSVGTVYLNGGVLMVTSVTNVSANAQTGGSPTSTFYFNGGTLEAKSGAYPIFFKGSVVTPITPITAIVQAGGAMVNDGGNAISITEPLLHDSTLGSTPDGGLTKSGSGTLTLTGANTYTGPTTVSSGALALSGSASIANSSAIAIAGGMTFNVSGLSSTFGLWAGQVLSNNTSTAVINGNASAGLGTLSLKYTSGTPSLSMVGGTLTLSSGTVLTINNTGPALEGGTHIIIAAGGGTVGGTLPSSFTVTGNGIAGGTTAALQMSGGALELVVTPPTPHITSVSLNGATLNITATNGAANGSYVLLESTNVTLPLNQWVRVLTNNFDGNGNANLSTNILSPASPLEFYLLSQ
jgi:autotransporter-associated beta strand protein